MPISAPIVTTPVPPMPVTRMFHGCARSVAKRRHRQASKSTAFAALLLLQLAAVHVTKLGQKPFTQE
jgi:hypothetical protein